MLTVVIPTYQERGNVEPLCRRLEEARARLGEPLEVLMVDDRSEDGTAAHAGQLLFQTGLGRVIERDGVRDLSQAVLEGLRQARGDLIGVMDADLSHPPELLSSLVGAIRSGCDIAVASRYVPGGGVANWPWLRRGLSRLANGLARPLTRVHDATSGYFVGRASVLRAARAQPEGFKILLELLATTRQLRVVEVPYRFQDRRVGASKLAFRPLWLYLKQLGRLYGRRLHLCASACR